MTTNLKESGHGPFMFIFRPGRKWYLSFFKCIYGVPPNERRLDIPHQLYKNECFRVEQEWWSRHSVEFDIEDIEKIVFMANSPATRIHPRNTKREYNLLVREFPQITVEVDNTRYPID